MSQMPSCDPIQFSLFQQGETWAWLTVVLLGFIWWMIGEIKPDSNGPKYKREYDPQNYDGRRDSPDNWKW